MATTARRQGVAPGASSARATASAASRTAAAMSASSSPTSSTVAAPVRSRAVRCSSRRRYAAASAAVGSRPAATGPSAVARIRVAGVRADRAQQVGPQFGVIRAGDGAAQELGVLRVPGQVIGQARADPEHRGQPVAEVLLGAERGAQGVLAGRGAEQPGQAGQGEVGIGRGRDRGDQRVGPQLGRGHAEVGEQQGLGPRGIRESHPRQPPCQRGPRATHPVKLTDTGLVRCAR